jgi:hypothetical protein
MDKWERRRRIEAMEDADLPPGKQDAKEDIDPDDPDAVEDATLARLYDEDDWDEGEDWEDE